MYNNFRSDEYIYEYPLSPSSEMVSKNSFKFTYTRSDCSVLFNRKRTFLENDDDCPTPQEYDVEIWVEQIFSQNLNSKKSIKILLEAEE